TYSCSLVSYCFLLLRRPLRSPLFPYTTLFRSYNELLEENKSLKSKISDLKRDVSLIYESTKEFLKERTDGLKAFKNVFKGFVDKVKDKTAQFQEKHDLEPKKNEFELT